MEQKRRMHEENLTRIKRKKKNLLHYLLVYLICLLAACITWFLVRYSMWEETADVLGAGASQSVSVTQNCVDVEGTFYV